MRQGLCARHDYLFSKHKPVNLVSIVSYSPKKLKKMRRKKLERTFKILKRRRG
jgi:uncharacterized membrane-anchored protein YitT (DUF2179 family)